MLLVFCAPPDVHISLFVVVEIDGNAIYIAALGGVVVIQEDIFREQNIRIGILMENFGSVQFIRAVIVTLQCFLGAKLQYN